MYICSSSQIASIYLLVLCYAVPSVFQQQSLQNPSQLISQCKPLLSIEFTQPNLVLECSKTPDKNAPQNNCSTPQSFGTVAKFYCKEHYVPASVGSRTTESRTRNNAREKYSEIWCNKHWEWEGVKELEEFRCREDCGKLLSKARPLIINGELSYRNFFPWHGTLFKQSKPGQWSYICGASLIRNQVLLSAAHCFTLDRDTSVDITKYRVVLGSTSSNYTDNIQEEGVQVHEIQRLYISDNYDPRKGFQADIAVVQLKGIVEFSEYVSPVCLPNDFTTDVNAIKNGETGLVAGFGVTENGKLSKVLRSAKIKVQTTAECQRSLKRVLPESQFCAGENNDDNWTTLCNGDSGGGFLFLSKVHEKYFIHGIVSSGESTKSLNKTCTNYSVFTRIYPFIFWILDVIEEINGEIARELLDNVEYPYALRGTEDNYATFNKLPREWENRITSLELEYVKIDSKNLIAALEYARPLTKIKLKHINFMNSLPSKSTSRVILPVLDSFQLHIDRDDFNLDNSRSLPLEISTTFMRSLIFFDKDYETSFDFENMLNIGVDIDIQINIFKLLHINHNRGEVFINEIGIGDQLFKSILSENNEFKVQTIALHRSELKIDQLVNSTHFSGLKNIILDQVHISEMFSDFIQNKEIKILALNPTNMIKLEINALSDSLEHLTINKNVGVNYDRRRSFPKLKQFCCDNCEVENDFLNNIKEIMSNAETIHLTTNKLFNISKILKQKSLRKLTILNAKNGFKKKYIRTSYKSNWTISTPTEEELAKSIYDCFQRSHFWTSEEEYRVRIPLKSNERKAIASGSYEYTGTKSISANSHHNYPSWSGIPANIQNSIKHIKLSSVDIDPFILADSIANAHIIESIHFHDVVLDSKNLRYMKLVNRELKYLFKKVILPNETVDYLEERDQNDSLIGVILPFQGIGRFNNNNHANSLHKIILTLNSYYVDWNTTVHYMLDVTYGEIRAQCGYFVGMFNQLDKYNELRRITHSIPRLYNTVVDGVLPKDWKFTGFQLITEDMINGFYQDNALKVFGKLGVLEIMLKKYGRLITIESSPNYENLKSPINFPMVQAIAAGYNYERLE